MVTLAEALFPLLTVNRFSFDVEIYYLLLKYNITIRRIPVCLENQETSSVSLFKHALPMAVRIAGIPMEWHAGRYRSQAMAAFSDRPYWDDHLPGKEDLGYEMPAVFRDGQPN